MDARRQPLPFPEFWDIYALLPSLDEISRQISRKVSLFFQLPKPHRLLPYNNRPHTLTFLMEV
jgi:hypothetical protein